MALLPWVLPKPARLPKLDTLYSVPAGQTGSGVLGSTWAAQSGNCEKAEHTYCKRKSDPDATGEIAKPDMVGRVGKTEARSKDRRAGRDGRTRLEPVGEATGQGSR